ncbi:aspartate kinase [Clostridium tyrobutyricum]|jgi:aspartate kinase|uniref:Aspartokinase n=1 Tax=Clostridium tyrobutyricum DIVETGP TaxID=1408889 RepID=W6N2A9_CLOTY|nr:aspartate kinase [Clostridium tyrobutyricum]AND85025.1 aspartokinase 1 [Clostridium tyrobutyricum]ANP69587.1 aspartate kinase [Clostridium tyrobutyricum]MBR9647071.1 aspartate kinase [Clostridium tyrobutyricum]MBV4414852.1 aspartate kinase [Clostridium tyrobutyricum]MBV4420713.1 aspartate kinase [Clostridium tyrobutyricum]
MKILVQKFGGTSVSTHERREDVVNKVIKAKKDGYFPVVVVSAMGRKGQPYATDTLLSLISDNFKVKNKLACDLIMSCGEIISAVVLSDEISKRELHAVPITGAQASIITDDNYNEASVINVDPKKLFEIIGSNKIPIVSGFQGISKSGFITTIGRGGSDVTAVLLGNALKAEKVEIYTDVDGIMTADPRVVADASLIKEISYNEVFQLADQGAKVIHPRAVRIAMNSNIPLVIKNTLNNSTGTIISNSIMENQDRIISGITSVNNRVQITVKYDENPQNKNYFNLFDELADNLISIDLINVFKKQKIFTIDNKDIENFKIVAESLGLKYSIVEECTKIALVGNGMRGIPGVMANILKILAKENIQVLQTADSHTTIWCLVESRFENTAINALHKGFGLSEN